MACSCGIWSRIWTVISSPTVVAIAAMPLLVRVETNRPSAATPTSDAATTSAISSARSRPSPKLIRVPEIVVTSPTGKSSAPTASAETATTSGRDQAERQRRRVLGEQQAGTARRGDQQIAQRARARLARDRVARDDADGHRQEEGQGRGERGEDQEQAVVGDLRDERRAACPPPPPPSRRRSSRS